MEEQRIWVQGQGEPIILVHGNGSTHKVWTEVIAHLQDAFRCVTYDLRGHGTSPHDASQLELETLVGDLEQVRRDLKCARATFVGHSLGAAITAAYALKYPEHVETLCLLAAPAARSQQGRQAAAALLENLRTHGVKRVMSTLVKSWYTEHFLAHHPAALRARLGQLDEIDDDAFIKSYELYNGIDIDPWLDRIVARTLVMTGELSRGSGADVAGFIANRLSNSKLVVIEGLKNGILTEAPDRVAAEIREFLSSP